MREIIFQKIIAFTTKGNSSRFPLINSNLSRLIKRTEILVYMLKKSNTNNKIKNQTSKLNFTQKSTLALCHYQKSYDIRKQNNLCQYSVTLGTAIKTSKIVRPDIVSVECSIHRDAIRARIIVPLGRSVINISKGIECGHRFVRSFIPFAKVTQLIGIRCRTHLFEPCEIFVR